VSGRTPSTFGDFHFMSRHYGLWGFPIGLSNASTVVENLTFGAGLTKMYIYKLKVSR